MYCVNCGNELDSDARFCPNCGFTVKGNESEKSFASNAPYAYYSYDASNYHIQQLKTYVRVIAIVQIIIGFFAILDSMIYFWIRKLIINANQSMNSMNTTNTMNGMNNGSQFIGGYYFLTSLFLIIGIFLILLGIFAIISGIGMIKHKKWSKVTSMIVGCLTLINFPLGTMFGVFTLYYLSKPEINEVFH